MNDWINRYVQAVINRLPERDRSEVAQELTSNIYDMLSKNPTDEEIEITLIEMGSPATLAEEYRQESHYLISPRAYDDYSRVIKYLVPTVGGIMTIIGAILGGINSSQQSGNQLVDSMQGVFQKGIPMGLNAVIHASFWITIGFVIAEKTGTYSSSKNKTEWQLADLPKITTEKMIPLSDCIIEIVVMLFFSTLLLLEAFGHLSLLFISSNDGITHFPLFSQSFSWKLLPVIIIGASLTLASSLVKIKDRRWTKRVTLWTIFDSVVSAVLWIILLMQTDLIGSKFRQFLHNQTWGDFDQLRVIASGKTSPFLIIIMLIIVIATFAECCNAIYHFHKNKQATL